jgi:hypothetical protein
LVILISITHFNVFGELSSADKQEIKSLVRDSMKEVFQGPFSKKSPTTEKTVGDNLRDQVPFGKVFDMPKNMTLHLLKLPDIAAVKYTSNESFLHSRLMVRNFVQTPDNSSNSYGLILSSVQPGIEAKYSVEIRSNNLTGLWEKTISEITPYSNTVVSKSNSSLSFFADSRSPQNKIIDLDFNLSEFNFPDQYAVFIYSVAYASNGSWGVIDLVKGTLVPEPQYTISGPLSLDLKPGEQKDTALRINSSAPIKSNVILSSPPDVNLEPIFLRPQFDIPAQDTAYSALSLKALLNASAGSYDLPIKADVSFPSLTPNVKNSSARSLLYHIVVNSSLPVRITSAEPPSLSLPPEVFAAIYTIVISTIVGWSIPSIASYISSRKRRKHFLVYITEIDKEYDTQKDNRNTLKEWLSKFERKMQYALGNGEISESQYDLLKKKIDYYSSDHVNPEER